MDLIEHPWNWIRVIRPLEGVNQIISGVSSDHAGLWETSTLMALYPEAVKKERVRDTDEWFCQAGADATVELGNKKINVILDNLDRLIQ